MAIVETCVIRGPGRSVAIGRRCADSPWRERRNYVNATESRHVGQKRKVFNNNQRADEIGMGYVSSSVNFVALSTLSVSLPSRSPLCFCLPNRQFPPSDDDDMIGYDVGLRPQPTPPPRRRPSTVATVASNRGSFVVRESWQGILR